MSRNGGSAASSMTVAGSVAASPGPSGTPGNTRSSRSPGGNIGQFKLHERTYFSMRMVISVFNFQFLLCFSGGTPSAIHSTPNYFDLDAVRNATPVRRARVANPTPKDVYDLIYDIYDGVMEIRVRL